MNELYRLIPDRPAEIIASRLMPDKLCEVRIRNGFPIRVLYDGGYYYLYDGGIKKEPDGALTADRHEADKIVMRACERSLYTVTDTLRRGYISVAGGIRIGVCGSGVCDKGDITAIKDISSVNIRLPHEVNGCAAGLYGKLNGGACNALIISPPGAGKTTVLRDLCRTVSDRGKNVLLCDEKHELAAVNNGVPTLDVGANTDIMCGIPKRFAFEMAVAYLRPDIIMADELFADELEALERAVHCGIYVVATVHARDLADFYSKREYGGILCSRIFTRFAVLTGAPHRGITVYDGERVV